MLRVRVASVTKLQQNELLEETSGNAGNRFGLFVGFCGTPRTHFSIQRAAPSVVSAVPTRPIRISLGARGD